MSPRHLGNRRWAGCLAGIALAVSLPTPAREPASSRPSPELGILEVFVIDPTSEDPPFLADVWIAAGKIIRVEPREANSEPTSETRHGGIPTLPGQGRFLVPGFVETHAHVALGPVELDTTGDEPALALRPDPEVPLRSLLALLAHGVTAVRDPGGPTNTLVDLRRRLENGSLQGPRLRVAGAVIDRQRFPGLTSAVSGAEEVRAEVRRQASAGVDWIKLYTQLDEEELRAGIEEAHAQGLRAVAHLQRISWTTAAELGLDALVHAVPGSELLLPESSREAYRPDLASTRFLYSWFEHVDLEVPEIRQMLHTLRQAGTTIDLTLVAFEAMVRGNDPARTRLAPELPWAAPSLVENWRSFFTFDAGWTAEDYARAHRAWPKALAFARLLHDSGVFLTIGTDANNPWTVPGPSFHQELEILAQAGISNRDILRMATIHGARALGLEGQIGRPRAGFEADLVLLERNPLDDISATRDIVWVMRGGQIFEPQELRRRVMGLSSGI